MWKPKVIITMIAIKFYKSGTDVEFDFIHTVLRA